jgi:hypothetical protein
VARWLFALAMTACSGDKDSSDQDEADESDADTDADSDADTDADADADTDTDTGPDTEPAALGMESARIIELSATSAVAYWYTYAPATSQIDWGIDTSYGSTTELDGDLVTEHFVALTDLIPGTAYHVRVRSTASGEPDVESEDLIFQTLASSCETGFDHFVDAAAPVGGDGTSWATAWSTWEAIDSLALAPGDCVRVAAGSYDEWATVIASGGDGLPITFQPEGPVEILQGIRIPDGTAHVVVRGFDVSTPEDFGVYGIDVQGDDVTLLDNLVHDTHHIVGIYVLDNASDVLVRNNVVWRANEIGIAVSGTNGTVDHNDVSHSWCDGSGDADASRFFGTGNAFTNNFFHDMIAEESTNGCSPHCDCFQTYALEGTEAHDITIDGNHCYNICGQMMMIDGKDGTLSNVTVTNNLFEKVGAWTINGTAGEGMIFDHNTFLDGEYGFIGLATGTGLSVTNNLFYMDAGELAYPDFAEADYNLIFPVDCQSETEEAHGLLGVDPLFIDAAHHDFRPAPGSPACTGDSSGGAVGAFGCPAESGCWDQDGDGFGNPVSAACSHPETDCDDRAETIFPGATESCDGIDQDCDGLVDQDCAFDDAVPVLDLSFDGGTAIDASPNAFVASWEDGSGSYDGGAASFGGAKDSPYLLIADDPALSGMGLFTLSVRAKKASDAGGYLVNKHVFYSLSIGKDTVSAYVQTATGETVSLLGQSVASIDDTEWHDYAVRYDSRTGEGTLIVDDTDLDADVGTGFLYGDVCNVRDLYIGKDPWGVAFDGEIDEVTLWRNVP